MQNNGPIIILIDQTELLSLLKLNERMISMSTNNHKAEQATHAGSAWANAASDSLKDLVGLQIRTLQTATEKSIGLGHAVTEFYQNQLNESLKISQEFAKYSWALTDNLRKSATEATERALKSVHLSS